MSVTESDISWPLLRLIVQSWAGSSVDLVAVKPLYGGCINTTLQLSLTNGEQVVIKISPHRVNHSYRDEAHQLAILRELGLPVPAVYQCVVGTLDFPHSYLLMEFVEGVSWIAARAKCPADEFDRLQRELAESVARLHAVTGKSFGRVHAATDASRPPDPLSSFDRATTMAAYLNATATAAAAQNSHATSGETDTWTDFYRTLYQPIFDAVKSSPLLPVKSRRHVAKIHDRLPRWLEHGDSPRLVHWDLWSGNLLAKPSADGRWHIAAVLDPNCKFAHAEAELAYLELFHTTTPVFLKAYHHHHALSPDYHRLRKPVYQLYELMNHVQLFGKEYVGQMCETLHRVMM